MKSNKKSSSFLNDQQKSRRAFLKNSATFTALDAATMAAFKGGADGVILSRKYSEMWLANLSAAGRAIRDSVKL